MPRIPSVDPIFPDPALSRLRVEERLTAHFRRLLERKGGFETPEGRRDGADGMSMAELPESFLIPRAKARRIERRIERRAERIAERAQRRSPLAVMRPDDRKRIETLREGVDPVPAPTEHRADEVAAELPDEFPLMGRASSRAGDGTATPSRHGPRWAIDHLCSRSRSGRRRRPTPRSSWRSNRPCTTIALGPPDGGRPVHSVESGKLT